MARLLFVLMLVLASVVSVKADAGDLVRAGVQARERGELDRAIDYFSRAIAGGGLTPAVLARLMIVRGVTYDMKNDLPRAIDDFGSAIKIMPHLAEAFIDRGLSWARVPDPARAIADFSEAARLDPTQAFLALSNRGNVYKNLGEDMRAVADYNEAIRLRPDYPASFYNRGLVYSGQEDFQRAIVDFTTALKADPSFGDALVNRSAAYAATGDLERAMADLDAAIRINPLDSIAFGNRGTLRISQGEFARALIDFDAAVRLKPKVGQAYAMRGIARFYSGQPDSAIDDLTTAARLSPSDAATLIWLHTIRVRAGHDDLTDLETSAARIDRKQWPAPIVDLHLGVLRTEALQDLQLPYSGIAMQRTRKCELHFQLGVFHLEEGRSDQARRELETALEICIPGSIERTVARVELRALVSKP